MDPEDESDAGLELETDVDDTGAAFEDISEITAETESETNA